MMPLSDTVDEFSMSNAGKKSKTPLGKFNCLTKKAKNKQTNKNPTTLL